MTDNVVKMPEPEKIVVHKASKSLQIKAGLGRVPEEKIRQAKRALEEFDYLPFAQELVAELAGLVEQVSGVDDYLLFIAAAKKIVTNLKSSAAMFGFYTVADLTTIMFDFLEGSESFDEDIIDLIDGHAKTLGFILSSSTLARDREGAEQQALRTELSEACLRYRNRQ